MPKESKKSYNLWIEPVADFERGVKDMQKAVDCEGAAAAALLDVRTGEIIAQATPLPESAKPIAGYSATYSAAWDEMIARRNARLGKGEKLTTDA